jgi:hypothetical protein
VWWVVVKEVREVLILRAKIRCMRDHVTSRRSLVSSLDPQVTPSAARTSREVRGK